MLYKLEHTSCLGLGAPSPTEDLRVTPSAGGREKYRGSTTQQGQQLAAHQNNSQGRVFGQCTLAAAHRASQQTASPAPRTMEKNSSSHGPKRRRLARGRGGGVPSCRRRESLELSSRKKGGVTQGKQNHEETQLERIRKAGD